MQKDIRLALHAGIVLDTPLPSAALLDRALTRARALGYSHSDIAAFFETLAQSDARTIEDRHES
jgi:3-hydroxyisobutyrate dehydrogenase-like beta-hydroxyacid dehydrogenase